jgi:hypothetical protein
MEQQGGGPPIDVRITLSAGQAHALLQELATDDDARDAFEHGTHNALVTGGIEIHFPEEFQGQPSKLKLPPKWQLEDLLNRLEDPWSDETRVPLGHSIYMLVLPYGGPMPEQFSEE